MPSKSCLSVVKPGGKTAVHPVVLKSDYGKRRLLLMLEKEVVERKWRIGGGGRLRMDVGTQQSGSWP